MPAPNITTPTTDYSSEREALFQFLTPYRERAYDLPSLTEEQSAFERWAEGIKDYLKTLEWWLRSLLGDQQISANPDRLVELSVWTVFGLLLVSAAVWLLLPLLRRLLLRLRSAATDSPGVNLNQSLDQELHVLTSAGDWSSAMRKRWQLFLLKADLPPDRTPLESINCAPYLPWDRQEVTDHYAKMFPLNVNSIPSAVGASDRSITNVLIPGFGPFETSSLEQSYRDLDSLLSRYEEAGRS